MAESGENVTEASVCIFQSKEGHAHLGAELLLL